MTRESNANHAPQVLVGIIERGTLRVTAPRCFRTISEVGVEQVASYCRPFTHMIADFARKLGWVTPKTLAPHLLGLRLPTTQGKPTENGVAGSLWTDLYRSDERWRSEFLERVKGALKGHKVYVSLRAGAIRIAVYLYISVSAATLQ